MPGAGNECMYDYMYVPTCLCTATDHTWYAYVPGMGYHVCVIPRAHDPSLRQIDCERIDGRVPGMVYDTGMYSPYNHAYNIFITSCPNHFQRLRTVNREPCTVTLTDMHTMFKLTTIAIALAMASRLTGTEAFVPALAQQPRQLQPNHQYQPPHSHQPPELRSRWTTGQLPSPFTVPMSTTALSMNMLTRFYQVAKSNINNLLRYLEDPEKIMNQAVEDMQVRFDPC